MPKREERIARALNRMVRGSEGCDFLSEEDSPALLELLGEYFIGDEVEVGQVLPDSGSDSEFTDINNGKQSKHFIYSNWLA